MARAAYPICLAAAVLIGGCATTTQAPPDPVSWGRIDCGPVDTAEMETQFEQARIVCANRAEAARVAGTASIPMGYGWGGAIASGVQAGIAGAQIQSATINACMGEYGFLGRVSL